MAPKTELEIADMHPPSSMDDLHHARGQAIHQYVHLEKTFITIFEHAVGARVGNVINQRQSEISKFTFSQMVNTRSRNAILEKSLGGIFQGSHKTFRNGLMSELSKLDAIRNQLAHWEATAINGTTGLRWGLHKPGGGHSIASLFTDQITDYTVRLRFAYYLFESVNLFARGVGDPQWILPASLQEIFLRPVSYPPPLDHPLVQIWQGPVALP